MLTPMDDGRTFEAFLVKVPLETKAAVLPPSQRGWLGGLRLRSPIIALLAVMLNW